MHSSLNELKYFVEKLKPYRVATNVVRPTDDPGWDAASMLRHFEGLGRVDPLNSSRHAASLQPTTNRMSPADKLQQIYQDILGTEFIPLSSTFVPSSKALEPSVDNHQKTAVSGQQRIDRSRVEEFKRQLRVGGNGLPLFAATYMH